MIKVSCRTNLDDYKQEVWPNFMYNPQKGDKVESQSGKKLEICQITHCQDIGGFQYLKIELTKTVISF